MDDNVPNAHQVRTIASTAVCDPATVRRYFDGEVIRSTSKIRIDAALDSLKIPRPAPATPR